MVNNGDYYKSGKYFRRSVFGEQSIDGGKSFQPRPYGPGISGCEALGLIGGVLGGWEGHVPSEGGGPWSNSGLGVVIGGFLGLVGCAVGNHGHTE